MSKPNLDPVQFLRDFRDGFISHGEAKNNSIERELRVMINSRGPVGEDDIRMTHSETESYVKRRGAHGLTNLLLLQRETQTNLFSGKAIEYLNQKFMERVEHLFPEVSVMARGSDYFILKYQEQLFQFLTDWQGVHIDLMTGFSSEQSAVYKIQFFHDLFIDRAGVSLTTRDEETERLLIPTFQQIILVREKILDLHDQGYNMEPELRVFQNGEHQVRLDAYRWRNESDVPNYFVVDEAGETVPSDIQEVVLTIASNTGEVIAENPGKLPR